MLDPRDGADLTTPIIDGYAATEAALLAEMAASLTVDVTADDWSSKQQAEQLRFRQTARRLVAPLQAGMPKAVATAVAAAAEMGAQQADDDLATTRGAALGPVSASHRKKADDKTARLAESASRELFDVNAKIPGAVDDLYNRVKGRVDLTASSAGTREQAVQQALDILTARGITGFRDNAGKNWALSTYVEMKSRTVVNQQLIDAHTDRMLARGQTLIIVSSHSNPAPVCQPYEGQVLSLNGDKGTILRPSKTGGPAVKITIADTLQDARKAGFQHPNCAHAVSAFIPGATRTYETTPDPEGYAASQKQRAMERAIRDTKRKQAVAVTSDAKKQLSATLRSQQASLRSHLDEHGLKRRPKRERIDYGYRVNEPGTGGPTIIPDPTPPKPVTPAGDNAATKAWLEAEAKHKTDVTAWLEAEKAFDAERPLSKTTRDLIEQARADLPKGEAGWDSFQTLSKDANGAFVPSRQLKRHLETVKEVGQSIRADIARRLDASSTPEFLQDQRDRDQAIAKAKALRDAGADFFATMPWDQKARFLNPRVAKVEQQAVLEALADVRSFGGFKQTVRTLTTADQQKLAALGNPNVSAVDNDALALLRHAENFYPTEWLQAADARGSVGLGYVNRGFFLQKDASTLPTDTITVPRRGSHSYDAGAHADAAEETMIHELGHRMEQAIPGITQLEFALARSRATHNGVLEDLGTINGSEKTYVDQWANAYAGRSYIPAGYSRPDLVAHEVFQVGTQDLYGRSMVKFGDDELEDFMMGVLALL